MPHGFASLIFTHWGAGRREEREVSKTLQTIISTILSFIGNIVLKSRSKNISQKKDGS